MVQSGDYRFGDALRFQADGVSPVAFHDGVAGLEPSLTGQDSISRPDVPYRFEPFRCQDRGVPVKTREAACEDIHFVSPLPEICGGNVRIGVGMGEPVTENPVTELVYLTMEGVVPSYSFGGKVRRAKPAEKRGMY